MTIFDSGQCVVLKLLNRCISDDTYGDMRGAGQVMPGPPCSISNEKDYTAMACNQTTLSRINIFHLLSASQLAG